MCKWSCSCKVLPSDFHRFSFYTSDLCGSHSILEGPPTTRKSYGDTKTGKTGWEGPIVQVDFCLYCLGSKLLYVKPVFLNQWHRSHQWYLRWCLVVLVELLDPCCPTIRPGTQHNRRCVGSKACLSALKKGLPYTLSLLMAPQRRSNWRWCHCQLLPEVFWIVGSGMVEDIRRETLC